MPRFLRCTIPRLCLLVAGTSGAVSQTFIDVSDSLQVPTINGLGYHGVWIDYNSDGYPDILGEDDQSLFLFRNNNGSSFTNVTPGSGLAGLLVSSISAGDYDNDGFPDLLLDARVYRNMQGQSFQLVYTAPAFFSRTVWTDYDGDGLLDIFGVRGSGTAKVFRNIGSNVFEDVTHLLHLPASDNAETCAAADFDNDGFTDIYIGRFGINQLLRNIAGEDFENQPVGNGFGDSRSTVSVAWGDYNNDGFLDIYSANISSNRNALFRNNANRTFTDVTLQAGVRDVGDARVATFLDYNNDGLIDIFATNHVNPNRLFRNNGDGTFTDVASASGIAGPQDGFGVSWADFDQDGDLDVIIIGHEGRRINLFRNNGGNLKNWLVVRLRGVFDNRMGIGARVEVFARGRKFVRECNAGEGNRSHNAWPAHFGLDTMSLVDSLVVRWPSGMIQKRTTIAVNQLVEVVQEGNVPPRAFRLFFPPDDSTVVGDSVRFAWRRSSDPDSNHALTYTLRIQSTGVDTVVGPVQDTTMAVHLRTFIQPPTQVRWYVVASDGVTMRESWDNWRFNYQEGPNAVDGRSDGLQRWRVLDAVPNPFNPTTTIGYEVPVAGMVSLTIYDLLGRKVRSLVEQRAVVPGRYTVVWDGTADYGMRVPTGMYLIVMVAADGSGRYERIQKAALLR